MKRRKQNKLLKAVAKGKCKRISRLCDELGYGPDIREELILRAHFGDQETHREARKHSI